MNSSGIYLEITQTSLKVLRDENGLDVPLERAPNGRITDASKQQLATALRSFLSTAPRPARLPVYCAIDARGVSLRRLTIPSAGKDQFRKILRMQIESEFPLSPDELAWGYRSLGETRTNGAAKQDLLVIAVKKEVIEEYSTLLSQCGLSPEFTLAALARRAVLPQSAGSAVILEIGEQSSELISFEQDIARHLRILPLTEKQLNDAGSFAGISKTLNGSAAGRRWFIAGSEANFKTVSSSLREQFGSDVDCESLKVNAGPGRSPAILGLKHSAEAGEPKLIFFQSAEAVGKPQSASPAPRKWAMIAAALIAGLVLLPYAEAILLKPFLAKKLAALNADQGKLAIIDQELSFLQELKQNQPPYLDSLYLFSKSAPSGAKIESLTLNRKGDVSLRGTLRNADQVAEFRNKLIASGFFSSVTVEDQSPSPDKQKLNVRISAQWKPANVLQTLKIGPTAEEIEKAKNKKDAPPMGMPAGFPPGMMPPGAMSAGFSPGAMPPGAMTPGLPPGVRISSPRIERKP